MKIEIVGIQDQKYTLDNGYSFDGLKLHCLDLESSENNLVGKMTTTVKIPRNSPYISSLTIGMVCNVYFDQKGRVDLLQPVK